MGGGSNLDNETFFTMIVNVPRDVLDPELMWHPDQEVLDGAAARPHSDTRSLHWWHRMVQPGRWCVRWIHEPGEDLFRWLGAAHGQPVRTPPTSQRIAVLVTPSPQSNDWADGGWRRSLHSAQ